MGSRIEAGLTVEGSVRGEGELIVAGRLRGVLTLQGTLIVEEGGAVEAEVEASAVVVAGLLSGSVTAHEELRVLPGGIVDARVRATRLAMAEGAIFRGELQAATVGSQPAQALTASTAPRIGARQTVQQLTAGAYGADVIPPLPTLNKPPHASTQVAAPPPPVHVAPRHQTIKPPPPAQVAQPSGHPTSPFPAAIESIPPTPTTPAPAPSTKSAHGTIPPPPRMPDIAVEGGPAQPPQSGPKARAFATPNDGRSRTRNAPPKAPEARVEAPRERDRSVSPRMPALPARRSSMSRRGGS